MILRKKTSIYFIVTILIVNLLCSCSPDNNRDKKDNNKNQNKQEPVDLSTLDSKKQNKDEHKNLSSSSNEHKNLSSSSNENEEEKYKKEFIENLKNIRGIILKEITIDGNTTLRELIPDYKSLDKVVLVNAANENITIEGGGLNKGMTEFALKNEGIDEDKKAWKNIDGSKKYYQPGYCGVSIFNQGFIYHGVGPQAKQVGIDKLENLEKVTDCLKTLYSEFFHEIKNKNISAIVLPIISGNIFASSGKDKNGKEFSKADFLKHVYDGIIEGVKEGSTQFGYKGKIIFNTK